MQRKYPTSIDGFISRRQLAKKTNQVETNSLSSDEPIQITDPADKPVSDRISNDLYQSIASIDSRPIDLDEIETPKKKKKSRLVIKLIGLIVFLLIVGFGGYFLNRVLNASEQALSGDWTGFFQTQPLKTDSNGRTNLLIFGTAEDDEGGTHSGGNLTDSIMVVSYSKNLGDLSMVSLPRDLWVQLPNLCSVGQQEKLNTVYFCGSDDGVNEAEGSKQLTAKVSEITGLEIHYYAHLNFGAVVELIDVVGGIDVKIESDDPRGILDRNFDWKCNYKCYYVKYKNGELAHMDGEHALAFIRARNASGGYGLPNANFDREKNQQKVIKALVEKLTDNGTLTNFAKLTGVIDAVGKNLRTNVSTNEVRSLVDLTKEADLSQIRSVSLVGDGINLVKTGNMYGRSVVLPVNGTFDYSKINEYIAKQLSEPDLISEAAKVGVYNGSQSEGAAQRLAAIIEAKGLEIGQISNASVAIKSDAEIVIYALNDSKPVSLAKVIEVTDGQKSSEPPDFNYDKSLDILVLIKTDPKF